MKIDVLTLFPEMFRETLGDSIIGRARRGGLFELCCTDIRDYSANKHKKVDDYPYGAGGGMVMGPESIFNAYEAITEACEKKPLTIYMSPQGAKFSQDMAKELAKEEHIVILCGHYEGVDERILEEIVDMEVSIGDYVLTGGEIPAMVVIDAVARMIPGVIQNGNAATESHTEGLLEYPQYTRPPVFHGKEVPPILLSGHEAKIKQWRRYMSLIRTKEKRPDLFEKLDLSKEDIKLLEEGEPPCPNTD
ncbi:MAG: tRNA (guanosine(37)-N1)-methyltransferase TrmD [Clostridia bacterium]|nr:tRNA (guanosine(37)-N1)-methyltransferase TrmD [Clostridia bacterium]